MSRTARPDRAAYDIPVESGPDGDGFPSPAKSCNETCAVALRHDQGRSRLHANRVAAPDSNLCRVFASHLREDQ